MLAHNVFFSLNDASQSAIQALVNECHKYLADHPGMVFYAAGTLSDIDRPVSDRDYDVALHVVFTDRAAHDAYQAAPAHQEFIARNKANWKKVRVFDSDVGAAAR
jgi:quinol monooxygenase YgiN